MESVEDRDKQAEQTANRKRVKKKSLTKRIWYGLFQHFFLLCFVVLYAVRYFGRSNIPKEGGVLLVSNHQSHFDPPLIGAGTPRQINYLARKTLFKFKPFGWVIDSLDAIPLNNAGIGYEGIKETIKRLKNGEMVLMFPEGQRCWDGKIAPFKSGFLTLALRGKAAILPLAVSGVYESWPRYEKYPGPGRLRVRFGDLIPYEVARNMDPDELHTLVERKVHELFEELKIP